MKQLKNEKQRALNHTHFYISTHLTKTNTVVQFKVDKSLKFISHFKFNLVFTFENPPIISLKINILHSGQIKR